MIPALEADVLAARYSLLARATDPLPSDGHDRVRHDGIESLRTLISQDLLELARQGSPDDFADIYLGFCQELERFAAFCAYPALSHRALVALGGGFSAGKSSLINALIGARVLPVEIDPTTTLPAYVLAGERDEVLALNQYAQRIRLTDEEFASLTHDERERYGTQVARLLQAAFVVRANFPWPKLAFVDTPGFRAGADTTEADATRAQTQLDAAQAVVWVTPIKQGTLSEDDLAVLARLRAEQPRLVVLSHADQVTDADRERIVAHVQTQLATRNLPVEGVFPVSRHPKFRSLLEPLAECLSQWQGLAQDARFAHRFKALFVRYARGLEAERAAAERERHYLNRLLTLVSDDAVAEALPLQQAAEARGRQSTQVLERLDALRQRFFNELARVGKAVGVPLPEPKEIELMDIGGEPRLRALFAALAQAARPSQTPDDLAAQEKQRHALTKALAPMLAAGDLPARPSLLRRMAAPLSALAVLSLPTPARDINRLLRREPIAYTALAILQ